MPEPRLQKSRQALITRIWRTKAFAGSALARMLVHMTLRSALGSRLLLGDCATGTMIQAAGLPDQAFGGYVGCNDILNITDPSLVINLHQISLEAGADWIETNTFGANLTGLADYQLEDRLAEINWTGAQLARQVADEASTPVWPRYVLGSMGPGNKLPTLGQVGFRELRDAAEQAAAALIAGGVDGLQIETCQDLLQAKAAIIGTKRAIRRAERDIPVIVSITIEANGQMLLGTPVETAVTSLSHLGIDAIGLNCATGPDLMEQPLRELCRTSQLPVFVMPNAGLPVLGPGGAQYPLTPGEFASAMLDFAQRFGVASVAGCCGTTPQHVAAARQLLEFGDVRRHPAEVINAVSSLYETTTVRQDVSYLSVGERANVSGSKAFREALAADKWDNCVAIAKDQARSGAHVIDLCVDQTGRDTVSDMKALASRLATTIDTPIMLDSSKPEVLIAGLESLPGRCIVNSVNLEDAARYEATMAAVIEHGAAVVALAIDEAGLAITAERKLDVALRLVTDLTVRWGLDDSDIFVDLLTYPVTTGDAETRGSARATIEALRQLKTVRPTIGTILGVSNVSFGLKPAARVVLNSVFLDECRASGLDAAILDPAKIRPLSQLPDNQVQAARALLMDDRRDGDPLVAFMALFDDAAREDAPADPLAGLSLHERLVRRIVDALPVGLENDLDEALTHSDAMSVINDDLLEGMRVVGDMFGQGTLQLPFVLSSAEVMKKAVDHLEPALTAQQAGGVSRGTLVLATVAGDVHDIGKNLVDIIASNNGYRVINLGVRVPIDRMIDVALAEDALAIGMSGLLVKSAEVMRDNLAELTRRGLSQRLPVILGGAALNQNYVNSLKDDYPRVYYSADAFAGLRVLGTLVDAKDTAVPLVNEPAPVAAVEPKAEKTTPLPKLPRSKVSRDVSVPQPPFFGVRYRRGISIDEVVDNLDLRALVLGRWGMRTEPGSTFQQLMVQVQPRLMHHLDTLRRDDLIDFRVAYGYWPAVSEGQDLVLLDSGGQETARFNFPRQQVPPYLSLPDYFRDQKEAARHGPDVVALQLVTMGQAASLVTADLFASHRYRDYLELHGLTVQLAEALAETWHGRIREELGIGGGVRYSFGYPSCPDLSQRQLLYDLLGARTLGVSISPSYQLVPEQSTDAIIVHHPEARYFR